MKFLQYKGTRIELDYDVIHSLTTDRIIELRNNISDLRKLRALDLDVWLEFKEPDFQNIWMNQGLENDIISNLNSMIIKRRTKNNAKETLQVLQ